MYYCIVLVLVTPWNILSQNVMLAKSPTVYRSLRLKNDLFHCSFSVGESSPCCKSDFQFWRHL